MEWETIAESTTVKVDEDDIALIYSTKICGVPIVCQTLSCIACIFMFVIETEVCMTTYGRAERGSCESIW